MGQCSLVLLAGPVGGGRDWRTAKPSSSGTCGKRAGWNGRPKEASRGWRYAWDVEYQLVGLLTMGLAPKLPTNVDVPSRAVGSTDLPTHDWADRWRGENPNTTFDRMTRADAAWLARQIAAVTEEQLRAMISSAEFTRAGDAALVLQMLLRSRARVLEE